MAVSLGIACKQNSQSTANNTSNITVDVTVSWTYGSWNHDGSCNGSITIDGTKYTFSNLILNPNNATSGSQVIMTKTVTVTHDPSGAKTVTYSALLNPGSGISPGIVSASGSKVLTAIPRKSTLSAGNGTLGTEQTLAVTRQSAAYTHTITYKCGTVSGTIVTKSTATSVPWTPPVSLAAQNTTGTSVSIVLTITTYNGSTSLGSNTKTITCAIPASVKPTVSFTVSDEAGYLGTYGGYIQGMSKFKIAITAAGSNGSTISACKTTADGKTYTASAITTGVISGSGALTITVTVTDSRGRTATAGKTVTVLAYAAPKISGISVKRSDADGSANSAGAYLTVAFGAAVTALNDKNTAAYTVKYKKVDDDGYGDDVALTAYDGVYAVSGGGYTFQADTGSGYDIVLTVSDDFKSVSGSATGAAITKLWSVLYKGLGMAFGKMAELAECLDIGWDVLCRKNIWMNKYDDAEKKIYFQNNASREGKTYETDGVRPHSCQIYGGNGASTTAIGLWDIQDAHGIFVYDDVNKIVKMGGSGVGMALQLNGKSLGTGDSGWITATLTSSFTAYSTAQAPKYRKVLNTVEIKGGLKPTAELAAGSTTTIFTLPEGYRPAQAVYVLCQASIKNTWLLTINPGGTVTMSRYGLTEYIAATTGAWLPFHATFFAD